MKILILLILVLFFGNSINANEMIYNDKYVYKVSPVNIRKNADDIERTYPSSMNVQRKVFFDDNAKMKIYIKRQLKKLEKNWKKEEILSKNKYNLSYARVMFFIDGSGNIQSYKIKSSCVPSGDNEFIRVVKNHIKTMHFDSPPKEYKNKILVLTVKFNSFIPSDYTAKIAASDRYGVADLEISKNKSYFVMSYKKRLLSDNKEWK